MKLRLGVAGGPVPRDPASVDEALARQLGGLGVSVLTTHFQPTPEVVATHAERVRSVLASHGLSIVQATGYNPQLTHPDDDVLSVELARLRAAFRTARLLGAEMIISGCGSRHPSAFYGPHPENHLPRTRERLIASLKRAARWAEEAGVILALECHVTTALDTPEHIREIIQAVDSPWVRANFDPVNLLGDLSMVWHNADAMRRMWQTLGGCYAKSAHIKDVRADPEFVVHISEAPPGEGVLDLDAFFEVVGHLGEGTAVIVEHLPAEKAIAAIEYVKQEAEQRRFTTARFVRVGQAVDETQEPNDISSLADKYNVSSDVLEDLYARRRAGARDQELINLLRQKDRGGLDAEQARALVAELPTR